MPTQTLNHGSASAVRLISRIWAGVQMAYTRIHDLESKRTTDAALAELSTEQLDDIGLRPRDDLRPTITVEAGLMANLMSLR